MSSTTCSIYCGQIALTIRRLTGCSQTGCQTNGCCRNVYSTGVLLYAASLARAYKPPSIAGIRWLCCDRYQYPGSTAGKSFDDRNCMRRRTLMNRGRYCQSGLIANDRAQKSLGSRSIQNLGIKINPVTGRSNCARILTSQFL